MYTCVTISMHVYIKYPHQWKNQHMRCIQHDVLLQNNLSSSDHSSCYSQTEVCSCVSEGWWRTATSGGQWKLFLLHLLGQFPTFFICFHVPPMKPNTHGPHHTYCSLLCKHVHSCVWRTSLNCFAGSVKWGAYANQVWCASYLRMRGGFGGGMSHLSWSDWRLALSGLLSSWATQDKHGHINVEHHFTVTNNNK